MENKYRSLRYIAADYWEDWRHQYYGSNGATLRSDRAVKYFFEFKTGFFYITFKANGGGRYCCYSFDSCGDIILKFGGERYSYVVTEFVSEHNVLNFPFLFSLYHHAISRARSGRKTGFI